MHFCVLAVFSVIATVHARPWNATNLETTGTIDVLQSSNSPSPFIKTIDSMTTGFSTTLKTWSPSLTPILGMTSLAYVGYIGAVMYFPSALKEVGVPLLQDFKFDPRVPKNVESPSQGFVDSLATGVIKDMVLRTEAASVLKNTSFGVVENSMGTLKKTTKFLSSELNLVQRVIRRIEIALDPKCLARYMCQVGQFTSRHFPVLGPALRSINTLDLDEFSQALIDGTSIGDCRTVFSDCRL